MSGTTDFLMNFRSILKLQEYMLKEVCEQYQLTMIEANIISFLYNNPGKDTAGDIVELRRLSKGNVSQAVELLIQKSLLSRTPDETDRRRIHLSLLPGALPITRAIDRGQRRFLKELHKGFTEEELTLFASFLSRLTANTSQAMEQIQLHDKETKQ